MNYKINEEYRALLESRFIETERFRGQCVPEGTIEVAYWDDRQNFYCTEISVSSDGKVFMFCSTFLEQNTYVFLPSEEGKQVSQFLSIMRGYDRKSSLALLGDD